MSQQPHILIIDLPQQAEGFVQALAKVGRAAKPIQIHELPAAFEHHNPIAIVAPFEAQADVAKQIRAASPDFQFPVFVLEKQVPGSLRPLLPEMTARLPDDVDAGILAMRLQIALQNARSSYSHRATVVGIPSTPPGGSMPARAPSQPPGLGTHSPTLPGSAAPPPTPAPASVMPRASSLFEQPVTGATLRGSAAPPATSVTPAPGATSAPAPSPPATDATEQDPAQGAPESSSSATSTAPGLAPPSSPIAGFEPPGERQPTAASWAPAPEAPEQGAATLATAPPAPASPAIPRMDADPDLELLQRQKASKAKLVRWGAFASGGVVLLALAISLLSGSDDPNAPEDGAQAEAAQTAALATPPKDQTAPPPQKPTPSAPATTPSVPNAAPDVPASGAITGALPAADPAQLAAPSEADFFKVEGEVKPKSCEEILGHPRQFYAKTAKWKAAQAWKLSRKSLMAGKDDEAVEQMCRAAFIDVKSPARAGLVKYYLSQRALEQAAFWAKVGVEEKEAGAKGRAAAQLLGDVYSQMGQTEEAKKLWLESFGLTENDGKRLDAVCRTFLTSALKARRGGDSPLAEQLLRRAATFQPKDATIAAELAKTLLDNQQKTLAKRWAGRALELDQKSELAQNVLAQL